MVTVKISHIAITRNPTNDFHPKLGMELIFVLPPSSNQRTCILKLAATLLGMGYAFQSWPYALCTQNMFGLVSFLSYTQRPAIATCPRRCVSTVAAMQGKAAPDFRTVSLDKICAMFIINDMNSKAQAEFLLVITRS